jgi:hypothetical protein
MVYDQNYHNCSTLDELGIDFERTTWTQHYITLHLCSLNVPAIAFQPKCFPTEDFHRVLSPILALGIKQNSVLYWANISIHRPWPLVESRRHAVNRG